MKKMRHPPAAGGNPEFRIRTMRAQSHGGAYESNYSLLSALSFVCALGPPRPRQHSFGRKLLIT